MHAFGPVTPALFNLMGAGAQESTLEEDLGTGDAFRRFAQRHFSARSSARSSRVEFRSHMRAVKRCNVSTKTARWIIFATTAGIKPKLIEELASARKKAGMRRHDRTGRADARRQHATAHRAARREPRSKIEPQG